MKTLILVDLQNDFLPGGALPVPHGDAVIPLANRLQGAFRLVVATQDWHPANHRSFAANHPGMTPGDVVQIRKRPQVLWRTHCVQNTPGAAFAPGLMRNRINRVFRKGMDPEVDSYSGFFDNQQLSSTGLAEFLRAKKVKEVYVLGLATDYCVQFTALDAATLGFRTWLIEDACRGVDLHPGDVDRAIGAMQAAGVVLVRTDDVLRQKLD